MTVGSVNASLPERFATIVLIALGALLLTVLLLFALPVRPDAT